MSKSPAITVADDDDDEQERLTSKEFLDLIPHLSFLQILQVEIRVNNEWKPLISQCGTTKIPSANKNQKYCCTLCNVVQTQPSNMVAHISGKKHIALMRGVKDIFHPEYTYPKSTENSEQNKETKNSRNNETNLAPKVVSEQNGDKKAATTSASQDKKFVINPLARKRTNDSSTVKETNVISTAKKSIATELVEIPEVIIIDDNDDEQPDTNSPKNNSSESSAKKPKIIVSSFAKCTENLSKDSTSKPNENLTNQNKANSNADDEDKNKIHGFIGVEYVVKICDEQMATRYECSLCELNLGFDDMQKHLIGYSHRLKFCEKHFPTAIQQFRQYIINVPVDEHYKVMIPVLQKLAEAIEKYHGRCQPFSCSLSRFKKQRIRVLTEVFGRSHASEQDGPTFTHVIDSKEIDQFISKLSESNHQDKILKVPVFDNMKSTMKTQVQVVKHRDQISNAPIVKMADTMHTQFQMSQPYHFEGTFNAQPFAEPQIYMGQQPYMHQQPYSKQPYVPPQPFMRTEPQPFMRAEPQFSRQSMIDDETHKRMVDNFLKANNKDRHSPLLRSQHRDRNDRNDHYRDKSRRSRRSRSRSPPRSFNSYSTSPKKQKSNISQDIWRSYCRLVDHKLNALDERFRHYKLNPESHPSYKEEWMKFWHHRKSELVAMGKDYRTYNYQPDWVIFFNKRIIELYEQEFEALKIQSREELSLPLTNDFVLERKYYIQGNTNQKRKNDQPVELFPNNNFEPPEAPSKINSITHSLRSTETEKDRISKINADDSASVSIEDDETPSFVSVLRLLTALEEHLGSLGPKIVDLLTKALQAEKSSPSRGLALINEENCTLLETAMEKFKGLVIASILDSAKERALKKAIAKVSVFLKIAKKTRELIVKHPTPTASDETSKKTHLIQEKIAAALAAQGHTNLDREKLEQLATVCMLLDKKKREAAMATVIAEDNPSSSTRSQSLAQKPLSDALSELMGNFGSAGPTARKPASGAIADSEIGNSNAQYKHSSSSDYVNDSSTYADRNFGNTYGDNVLNFEPRNNRSTNFPKPMSGWKHHQQQNIASYNWNQDFNRAWNTNQRANNYPGGPNRPPTYQDRYM